MTPEQHDLSDTEIEQLAYWSGQCRKAEMPYAMHPDDLDRLIAEVRRRRKEERPQLCEECRGSGIRYQKDSPNYDNCHNCGGTGAVR